MKMQGKRSQIVQQQKFIWSTKEKFQSMQWQSTEWDYLKKDRVKSKYKKQSITNNY